MRRRLNGRFLVWSLTLFAVMTGSGLGVRAWQVQRHANAFLRQGQRALDKGDLDQGLAHLAYYLKFQPEDLDALTIYSVAWDKKAAASGDSLPAILALEKVLWRDPAHHAIRHRLILTLIRSGRYREAQDHLDKLIPHWPKPAELVHIKGWCQDAAANTTDDYLQATTTFARAVTLDPSALDSYVLWAEILHDRLRQPEEAAEVMDRMVKANPAHHAAYLIRARFRQNQDQRALADQDLQEALRLAPTDAGVLLAVAEAAQGVGDLPKALTFLQQGLDRYPGRPEFIRARANLAVRAGALAEAIAFLQRGLKDQPDAWDLQILLIDVLIDQKKLTEASEQLAELRRAGLTPALPNYLQARLQIERGNWTEASALLERVRLELGSGSAWHSRVNALLGACYEQIGDNEQRVAALRRAVLQEPGWTAARLGLAAALVAAERLDEALGELQELQKAPDAPAGLGLLQARTQFARNLRLPEKDRNWAEVQVHLTKAAKATPNAMELPLLQAEWHTLQKQFDRAHEVLEKAKAQAPREVIYWCALADLAVQRGAPEASLRLLDEAETELGDHLEIRRARCRVLGHKGDNAAKQALLALGENLAGWTLPDRTRLLRALADTWQRLGETTQAVELWRQLAQLQPHDVRSRFLLMEQAARAGQGDQARQYLDEIRKLEAEPGSLWRYGVALVLVHEARGQPEKLQEARKALTELARRRPDWSRVPLLEARIEELEGNYDQALNKYRVAIDLGELQPGVVVHAVRLWVERRRFEEAEQALVKVEERMLLPRELARLGAEAAQGNHRPARALQLATLVATPDSTDYRDLLWLARLHAWAGDAKTAETVFRRAAQRAGHAPDVWIALADHLARSGKSAGGDTVLQQMAKRVAAPLVPYARARCLEALGRLREAEATYQALAAATDDFALLSAAADFYRRAEAGTKAEPLWRKLLDPELGAPGELVAKTRRSLAVHLAGNGNPKDQEEALALVEINIKTFGDTLTDERIMAIVQGSRPAQRRAAMRAFEETLQRHPGSPDELLLLAKLHEAEDDEFGRVRELLLEALVPGQEAPHILAHFIRTLILHDEARDAQPHLTLLERLEPTSPRTCALQEAVKKAQN